MRNFKVAIYGTAASYHDLAAQKFYGQEVDIVECSTFRQCCEMLASNHADYAVMAIENTLAGSILANYNLIYEFGLRIIGEQYLKIELHLLALEGVRIENIGFIYSHNMALAQCRDFIARHPHIRIIERGDTASCVREIRENILRDTAAIGSELASRVYHVPVLCRDIGNSPENHTRFMILSKGEMKPENPNKASVCFRLRHEVGSLVDVLSVLKRNNVNLSKIQSVPVTGQPDQFIFHTDLEWDYYENFSKALKKIRRSTSGFTVLGEYIKAGLNN